MNYASIKFNDIANGPGVRTSLFVSGCRHGCPGCFNAQAWSFTAGDPYTEETEEKILQSLRPGWMAGVSLLGGEPMEPEQQQTLTGLLTRIRRELPGKTVWCYSGFTWEQLTQGEARCRTELTDRLLSLIDVLVDGPFLQAEHDISLRFRGSRNQRLLDVQASLREGRPVEWQDEAIYASHVLPRRDDWDRRADKR